MDIEVSGRRSPHGERGLKSADIADRIAVDLSLPSRGARIEMVIKRRGRITVMSLPSRGARIEMSYHTGRRSVRPVAPLTGSVD